MGDLVLFRMERVNGEVFGWILGPGLLFGGVSHGEIVGVRFLQ